MVAKRSLCHELDHPLWSKEEWKERREKETGDKSNQCPHRGSWLQDRRIVKNSNPTAKSSILQFRCHFLIEERNGREKNSKELSMENLENCHRLDEYPQR